MAKNDKRKEEEKEKKREKERNEKENEDLKAKARKEKFLKEALKEAEKRFDAEEKRDEPAPPKADSSTVTTAPTSADSRRVEPKAPPTAVTSSSSSTLSTIAGEASGDEATTTTTPEPPATPPRKPASTRLGPPKTVKSPRPPTPDTPPPPFHPSRKSLPPPQKKKRVETVTTPTRPNARESTGWLPADDDVITIDADEDSATFRGSGPPPPNFAMRRAWGLPALQPQTAPQVGSASEPISDTPTSNPLLNEYRGIPMEARAVWIRDADASLQRREERMESQRRRFDREIAEMVRREYERQRLEEDRLDADRRLISTLYSVELGVGLRSPRAISAHTSNPRPHEAPARHHEELPYHQYEAPGRRYEAPPPRRNVQERLGEHSWETGWNAPTFNARRPRHRRGQNHRGQRRGTGNSAPNNRANFPFNNAQATENADDDEEGRRSWRQERGEQTPNKE